MARARAAEAAGYHRFWVSEHHGVPGVASGRPALMAQAVASATGTIRIGSGGVMLPNHRPLVVAEEFSVLTALHGPRFDLGLGRSLGFTRPVREALGAHRATPREFGEAIEAVRNYLDGTAEITMRPAPRHDIPLFVLGTGSGLQIAAQLGLPVVVGGPILESGRETFDEYRENFRPTRQVDRPRLVVSTEVYLADTTAQARDLARPEAWAMARSRTTGSFPPLVPVSEIPAQLSGRQEKYVAQSLSRVIAGTEDEVLSKLSALLDRTGADELMSTASTFDTEALYSSDARLAQAVASL